MKGLQMLNGWCLLIVAGLLMMQPIDVRAAYSMEETCKFINTGFIADPTNCRGYGYCENSVLNGTSTCPPGAFYNADAGACQFEPKCRLNENSICQDIKVSTYFPHPDNCNEYIHCLNGKARIYKCGKNQLYDPVNNRCNWASQLKGVCTANSPCRLVKDNVFAADPKKCGNYILCQKGAGQSKRCPNDLYYSPISGSCQSSPFCVDDDNNNTNGGVQPPKKPNPEECKSAGQFISDEQTCYGYFKCTNQNEVGDWLQCPAKTHFNPTIQKCVTPYTYECPYDRCGNMNATFMGAIGNECRNYLLCQNNQYISKSTDSTYTGIPCKEGYFFNEFNSLCEKTSPSSDTNYKLCRAVEAPPPQLQKSG